jgi:hypothetical protein
MGTPNLVPVPADGDWAAVRKAIGPGGAPHFAGLNVDVLSVDSLTIPGLSGVLRATAGVLSGSAPHSALGSIGVNDHHNQAHVLDGADHTVSGLTPGHGLKALTATTFGFSALDITVPNPVTVAHTGVALGVTTSATEVTTDGDLDEDNGTLANGTIVGQIKHVYVKAQGNVADKFKVTPATMVGGTKISFDAPTLGKGCTLIWTASGWVCIGTHMGIVS